jgi:putative salt-induced outer membrane protein YdiY
MHAVPGAAVALAGAAAAAGDARSVLSLQPQAPPEPRSGDDDWVQLANGEWLKGEVTDLQDDDLVFESDELDELRLDWSDVHALYSNRINTVMLRDGTTAQGRLRIEGDEVVVITDEGETAYPRDEVRSIVPGELIERNLWSGKITLGATARRGNTNQNDFTTSLRMQRRDARSRFTLQYDGVVSEVDDSKVANSHRGLANHDVYLTERLYVRPIRFEAFRDEFSNIDYRLTPSAGLGYDIVDTDDLEWSVAAGAGWQFTEFDEAPPGEDERDDTAAFLLGTGLKWEATEKVDVRFEYAITVPVPETDAYNFRADFRVEVEIYGDLELDVGVIWDRINEPSPDGAGVVPDSDDVRVFVGLGWEF